MLEIALLFVEIAIKILFIVVAVLAIACNQNSVTHNV